MPDGVVTAPARESAELRRNYDALQKHSQSQEETIRSLNRAMEALTNQLTTNQRSGSRTHGVPSLYYCDAYGCHFGIVMHIVMIL
jgi:hypothetical protein